ncbi:PP2C family serine/threonine-protein phosphatase [uncultured Massilia sp.]|uniref:PP2C family protein-serine/threonine phosphatase n=1 Tax=uncultured Massilia sp. TaxID=169973 RepID=UPI0025F7FDC1|nr:protein phosphatase 2C domain-containing protein [uncultured Massilia sp.]
MSSAALHLPSDQADPAIPFRLRIGACDVAACSRRGAGPRLREENQDNLVVVDGTGMATWLAGQRLQRRRLAGWPPGHARLAVLDGMGGHGHGREAAEAVAAGLLALPPCRDGAALAHALDALHADLQRDFDAIAGSAGPRPGTTLTMLEWAPHAAPLLYHVGDSRLYEITAARVTPLTVDHVPATACALGGALDEAGWWTQVHGEHRPQLSQAFILGNAFADPARLADPLFALTAARLPPWLAHMADRRALALQPGATYLLATDGLWSCSDPYGWAGQWPQLLGAATDADAATMLAALLDAYDAHPAAFFHPDNVTAILLRIPGAGAQARDETVLPVA